MGFLSKRQLLSALLISAILFVAILAPLGMAGMGNHHMNTSERCPFMPTQAVLCEMNIFAHIASWQTLFTSLSPEFSTFTFLTLVLAYLLLFSKRLFGPPPRVSESAYRTQIHTLYVPVFSFALLGNSISPRAP